MLFPAKIEDRFYEEESRQEIQIFYQTLVIDTQKENLTTLDPRLAQFLVPGDYFYIQDLSKDLREFVEKSDISDGTLTAQILHTSATLLVNELDEPMLLGDIARKLRSFVPREEQFLHNSPLRIANRCAEDTHCDRNGDAHVKASLFGTHSISLIVRDGQLVLGTWQKVALIDFDGPRRREVLVQIIGR